jgi:hypothetical protein
MFDKDNILRSPREIAQDADAIEPLRLVLEDPHKARWTKLLVITLVCAALVLAAGFAIYGYAYFGGHQNDPGFWHISLVALLFWIGLSQGMVALSVILRITHASWRYPLNRLLDMGSLFGLWGPLLLPLLALVRHRIYNLGVAEAPNNVWRLFDPLVWDNLAVGSAYAAGWMLLYLTALPDFAMLRDRAPEGSKEKRFYQRIAGFWRGSEHQWRVLRRAEGVLVVGVIGSFVGSQTALGWDFQLAAARNWDSSIFAPLYTIGSLLGALALAVLVMTVTNCLLRGRGFFSAEQYNNLGRFMVGLGLVWFYFRFCDYLTAWYGHVPQEWVIQQSRTATFPILVGLMVVGCFGAPVFGNMIPALRKQPWWLCSISILILMGLAAQRYLDTVPTFAPKYGAEPLLPEVPSIVVFVGITAMFVLTYLLGARYFPIMSWWGTSKSRTRTAERRMGNGTVTVMVEDPPLWET